jgi:hypothetical protein
VAISLADGGTALRQYLAYLRSPPSPPTYFAQRMISPPHSQMDSEGFFVAPHFDEVYAHNVFMMQANAGQAAHPTMAFQQQAPPHGWAAPQRFHHRILVAAAGHTPPTLMVDAGISTKRPRPPTSSTRMTDENPSMPERSQRHDASEGITVEKHRSERDFVDATTGTAIQSGLQSRDTEETHRGAFHAPPFDYTVDPTPNPGWLAPAPPTTRNTMPTAPITGQSPRIWGQRLRVNALAKAAAVHASDSPKAQTPMHSEAMAATMYTESRKSPRSSVMDSRMISPPHGFAFSRVSSELSPHGLGCSKLFRTQTFYPGAKGCTAGGSFERPQHAEGTPSYYRSNTGGAVMCSLPTTATMASSPEYTSYRFLATHHAETMPSRSEPLPPITRTSRASAMRTRQSLLAEAAEAPEYTGPRGRLGRPQPKRFAAVRDDEKSF